MNALLADDHSQLNSLLEELYTQFEIGNRETIFSQLDLFWARLAMHIRAEHLHLFPAILNSLAARKESSVENDSRSFEAAQNLIAELREDHDFFMHELAAAVERMRILRLDKSQNESEIIFNVREKIEAIHQRLERHNELEESEVYRWLENMLDFAELADLNARMRNELNNLPPRFCNS